MSTNPYAPPTTAVADVPPPPLLARPWTLKTAMAMILVGMAVGLARAPTANPAFAAVKSPSVWIGFAVAMAFGIALTVAWLYRIWRGGYWARGSWVALILLGAVFSLIIKRPPNMHTPLVVAVVQGVLTYGACVLLFLPPTNEWFRQVRAARKAS